MIRPINFWLKTVCTNCREDLGKHIVGGRRCVSAEGTFTPTRADAVQAVQTTDFLYWRDDRCPVSIDVQPLAAATAFNSM